MELLDAVRVAGFSYLELSLLAIQAGCALQDGDAEQASTLCLTIERKAKEVGLVDPCAVPWSWIAIRSHLRAGRQDHAERVVSSLEVAAASLPCRWPRMVLAMGRGGLAASEQHWRCALGHYEEALAVSEHLGSHQSRSTALLAYGSALAHSGRPDRARSYLSEACRVAEEAGMTTLAHAARQELAAAGGRYRHSEQGLTPQERRVAVLALEGLTNPEIAARSYISVKTVETHLSRTYRKLGISSRSEINRALGDNDDGEPGGSCESVLDP
ncbi:MAG: helix-turn-helix transcriptional regulator [Acidimicrobiales bacterium]